MRTCIRCGVNTKNYPKPSNPVTCGVCLHDLHEGWKASENGKVVRGD